MRRKAASPVDAPGQDSFLDVVANLVGIMIILVMVVGSRAKDAMVAAAPSNAIVEEELAGQRELAEAQSAAQAVEADIHQLAQKIERGEFEVEYRRKERDKIQLLITAAEQAIQANRDQLDASQQQRFDLQSELIAARETRDQLEQEIESSEESLNQTSVIEHLPTPMAKTVFGKELHFRLQGGRIAEVPWDEMAERLKEEAPQKVWRLQNTESITETIGPIRGFLMRYELKRVTHSTQTRVGMAVQQRIELDHFVLTPVEENLGDPVSEALLDGSRFQQILAANRPDTATITIWTYPDSFNEFRELKKKLFERGFLTASRPMPEGMPIGGSPRGTRSASQ